MVITFHNHRDLPNKWIRRIKYLLYKLKEKFDSISYSHVYLTDKRKEAEPVEIRVVLGLPGKDIVYSSKSEEIQEAIQQLYLKLKRVLAKRVKRKT